MDLMHGPWTWRDSLGLAAALAAFLAVGGASFAVVGWLLPPLGLLTTALFAAGFFAACWAFFAVYERLSMPRRG